MTRKNKVLPQKLWVCFGCKTGSSGPDLQLWLL